MKKKSLALTLMLAFSCLLGGKLMGQTIEIGSDQYTSNSFPVATKNYYHSLSEQIYTASEITGATGYTNGQIRKIYFKSESALSRKIDIYIRHTTKSSFSSHSDWIPVLSTDLRYSSGGGAVSFVANDWTEITLDTPFEYDGTSNIVVIVDDNTGEKAAAYVNFKAYQITSSTYHTNYITQTSNTDIDPCTTTSGANRYYRKNHIELTFETISYPRPITPTASAITNRTASISWTAPTATSGYTLEGYQYKYTIINTNIWSSTTTTGTNSCDLESLSGGANYAFVVRAIYTDSSKETHYSDWAEVDFKTDCDAVDVDDELSWNFENSGSMPDCWNITASYISQSYGNPTFPQPYNSSSSAHSSNYSIRFCDSNEQVILLPAITQLNGKTLKFYAKASSATGSYTITVGYYNSLGVFTLIENNFDFSTTYPENAYEVPFNNLPNDVERIAIKGSTDSNSRYIYLDDVSIVAPVDCAPVTSPTVGTVTYNSAQLSWTAGGSETNWKLQYRASGAGSWTTVNVSSANLVAGIYTLDGLSENTTYEWQVAAWCDTSDNDNISTYVAGEDFSTPVQFPMPTSLAANNISTNSADITWTAGSTETAWQLYYSPYDYAHPGSASPGDLINVSTTPAYTMTGLTGNTTYYVYVRANYGEDHYSSWTDAMSFRTSVSLPYSYDFEDGSEMNYWTISNGNSTTGRNNSNGYNSSEYSFRFMYGSSYTTQYLISPELNNTTLGVHVEFFAYRSSNSNSGQSTLNVSYSTEGNNTFSWDDDDAFIPTYNSYILYKFDFPAGTKYIAIKYAASTYDYIYIDNISFRNSDNKFTTTGNWSTAANWSYGTLPTASDDVIINAACTIPNACIAEANNITLGPSGSLTIEDGGQLICNNAVEATVHKTIAAWNTGSTDGWYFIASPINVNNLAPTNVTNMISDENAANGDRTYDLYSLDNITWHNYRANNFNLANGRGYLYASEGGADLQFSGAIKAYDADHTILVSEGWNLIGNPYTFEAYPNQAYYTINDANSGITAQTSTSSAVVAPCTGIIVKAAEDGTVKFLKDAPETSANNGNIQMVLAHNVNVRGDKRVETIDNAIVSFNEGSQLEKFYFGNPSASIFIPQNGEDYAIAFSDRQGDVPLYFKANETGTYTISFAGDEMSLNGIYLIDILAEEEIDLSVNPSYTFIGSPADRMARFKIVFRNANGDGTSDIFAYQNGNDIIVSGEGELQIFDVMGRMVSRQRVNGVETVNAMPYGVYILKLNGMTQKIVVR